MENNINAIDAVTIINSTFEGGQIHVSVSSEAKRQLKKVKILHVGMELYFNSFVEKILHFSESKPIFETERIAEKLRLYFRPIQSRCINIHELTKKKKLVFVDFPIRKRKAITPNILFIDFINDSWEGDFTWDRNRKLLNI